MAEEVRGRHRHDQTGPLEGGAKPADDAIALARAGPEGHEIVVVQ